jgi:hypothetical protein
MILEKQTDKTLIADLTLTSADIGFDLRLNDIIVDISHDFRSVLIDQGGDVWRIEGTREEMIAAMREAGYRLLDVPMKIEIE